ncbi:MAG: choice-of-anchor J domain-containing protein [Candidatus Delongbacteria bacterium]|nr:choice-of-anchor J domain-containing protein [Candidatus Delongbacteria bacterium]MBN2836526.1 choice-of-anchor J domain-containing protein [Candidatus Delongbacteria bacterium]
MKKLFFFSAIILALLFVSCDVPSGFDVDSIKNSNPTVDISLPPNCPCVSIGDSLNITATANDIDGSIDKVIFEINGLSLDTLLSANDREEYSYTWIVDSLNVKPNNQIKVIALDKDGGLGENSIFIIENRIPICEITNPQLGELLNYDINYQFKVRALDPDGLGLESIKMVINIKDTLTLENSEDDYYTFNWTATDFNLKEINFIEAIAVDFNGSVASDFVYTYRNNRPTMNVISPKMFEYHDHATSTVIQALISSKELEQDDFVSGVTVVYGSETIDATKLEGSDTLWVADLDPKKMNVGLNNISFTSNDSRGGRKVYNLKLKIFENPVFSEDFENYEDFTLDFLTQVDYDSERTILIDSFSFLNEGYFGSFIVFNPNNTTPPIADDTKNLAYSGSKYAAAFGASGGTKNNDWLISEPFLPTQNSKVSLWVKTNDSSFGLERFQIYVFPELDNHNNPIVPPEDIQSGSMWDEDRKLTDGTYYDLAEDVWTQISFDLDEKTTTDRNYKIGIRYRSVDGYMFMVDDFHVFNYEE